MNILFLTPPPYLPNRLHRNRSFDLIKILAKKHTIHLLCVTTKKDIPKEFSEIKKVCKSSTIIRFSKIQALLNCLLFPMLPAEVAYCYSKKTKNAIKKIIAQKKVDLIYAKRLRSTIYLTDIKTPVLLDSTDAMSLFYKRLLVQGSLFKKPFYFLEWLKYRRYERTKLKEYKAWITSSQTDKEYLLSLEPKASIFVVDNPVDTDFFKNKKTKYRTHSLLFRGLMDKPVNIDAAVYFAHEIFPVIEEKIPGILLTIVGPNPTPRIKALLQNKNIQVAGYVKDIREAISNSALTICPLRIGTGTKFKILQSWAMEKPVVSTTIGAEGLPTNNGVNILIADKPKEFGKKIIALFKHRKQYTALAKNGRKTVILHHSFPIISKKLEKVISHAIK